MSELPAEQHQADSKRAAAGDRAAFHRLVHATARLVLATVVLEVRDPHLADDLTQETFLRAWKSIGTLKDPSRFNAWLIGIAKSACIDAHRHRSRKKRAAGTLRDERDARAPRTQREDSPVAPLQRVEDGFAEEAIDPSPGPLALLAQSDQRDRLFEALNSLPQPQRQVLAMRYLSGADYETIAASLNLTDGQLRGLLHRGLAALRNEFPSLSPTGSEPE